MIAVDTNILVYAHREDLHWYEKASALVQCLAEGRAPWAIPWPCIHEFLSIVTNPRIFSTPTPLQLAFAQVEAWMESPTLVMLAESHGYWEHLRTAIEQGQVTGARVHDARIELSADTMILTNYGQPTVISVASPVS